LISTLRATADCFRKAKTLKLISSLIALMLGIALFAPGNTAAQTSAPLTGPEVVRTWVGALASHDLDAALLLLADESFLIFESTQGDQISTYAGKGEIRTALGEFVAGDIQVRLVSGPQDENGTVFWLESRTSVLISSRGIASAEYTGQALVTDGKIVSLIYTPTPETEAALNGPTDVGMPTTGAGPTDVERWAIWIAIGLWSVMVGVCLLVFNRREAEQHT